MSTSRRTNIINSGAGSTNLGHNPDVINVDKSDHDGILARLESLMVLQNVPEYVYDNKRFCKFRSIVKLARSNVDSVREKRSEGKSVLDNFSDGSLWFVAAVHSVPEENTAECSQLISQFSTNGHNLCPRQNDEIVKRLFGICGYINFLEANSDRDVFKFLWSLYSIRAMTAPGVNTVIPSMTVAIGSEKMQEIWKQLLDGELEQERQLPSFQYDDAAVKIQRTAGKELQILNHDIRTGTITVKYPVVKEVTDNIEYSESEWNHHWVKREVYRPKVDEEVVTRTLVDENRNKIQKKTGSCIFMHGKRDTFQWRKTGKKIQKTVKRPVAVEKVTTHSMVVNDRWKKTGNMLRKEFEYQCWYVMVEYQAIYI